DQGLARGDSAESARCCGLRKSGRRLIEAAAIRRGRYRLSQGPRSKSKADWDSTQSRFGALQTGKIPARNRIVSCRAGRRSEQYAGENTAWNELLRSQAVRRGR